MVPEIIPIGTFIWFAEHTPKLGPGLHYRIKFIESIGVKEDDVKIYSYISPSSDRVWNKEGHSSIQTPLGHIVDDYRYILNGIARREHADEWNTQAKMVCSYSNTQNIYSMSEGNPITNDWSVPQNRGGHGSDLNLPSEMEQNVYVRDSVTEKVVSSKNTMHIPTVYSLPKNTKLESINGLQSTVDIKELQENVSR